MKAVIMAGGKGTRISTITNDEIPKPMLTVAGIPILEHQINCLKKSGINEIIIVIGHLGDKIKDYFGDGAKWQVKITYFAENPEQLLGTAGSLYYLKEELTDDFILIFGDVFLSVDFKRMIAFHRANKADATLLTHPNSHPFDSDLIITKDNRVEAFDSKENVRNYDYSNMVNSGIYLFSPKILDYITKPQKYNLEKDIIKAMLGVDRVFAYHSTEYVKDMGTPERYQSVNDDYANGICEKRNLANKQKAIFLDRDGTINEHKSFLVHKEDLALIPGVAEAIKLINASEYLCIVITNQPIIARGESTVENLNNIHRHLETLLGNEGAYLDGLYYCPHHPDKGFEGEVPELKIACSCRKPQTGLLTQAAADFNLDIAQSFVIGDSTCDIQMAHNVGIPGILVQTGEAGRDGKYDVSPDEGAEDLLDAVQKILKRKKR